MAQVAAHGEQANPAKAQQVQHAAAGKKRAAEAPLENEQRLSKRFDLLNLGMYLIYLLGSGHVSLTAQQWTTMAPACTSPSQALKTPQLAPAHLTQYQRPIL